MVERAESATRIEHVNDVLRAVQRAGRVLTQEQDPDALVRRTVDVLAETRGFSMVGLVRRGRSGLDLVAAGHGARKGALLRMVETRVPECLATTLRTGAVVTHAEPRHECEGCPIACQGEADTDGAFTVPVRCDGVVRGALLVTGRREHVAMAEETEMLRSLGADVAHALRSAERRMVDPDASTGTPGAEVVWVFDLQTRRYRSMSPNVLQLRGFTADEMRTRTMEDTLAPESVAYLNRVMPARIEAFEAGSREVFVDDLLVKHKNGSLQWTESRTHFVRDGVSLGILVYGTSLDASARKDAEVDARYYFDLLLRAGRVATVGSWEFDAETGQARWSETIQRMFGLPEGQEASLDLGKSFFHGAERTRLEACLREWLEGRSGEIDLEMTTVAGTTKRVRAIGHPRFDDGKVVRVRGTMQELPDPSLEVDATKETLLDTTRDLVWLKDVEGVFLGCNARFELLVGTPRDAVVGRTDHDFVPHDVAEFFREHDRRAIVAQVPSVNDEWVTFASDGHRELLETVKAPVYGPTGNLVGVLGIGRDVTAERQGREVLKQRRALEGKLIAVAATVPGVICTFRLSADGKASMPFASPRIQEFYGLDPEVLRNDCGPLFARIHPDDVAAVNATIGESAASMTPWRHEWRYDHPVRGEMWIGGHSMPRRDEDGGVSWDGYVQDVTERKRAEQAIRRSEEKYRALVEGLNDVVFSVEADGRTSFVNPAVSRFGYAPADVVGQHLIDFLHPEDRRIVADAESDALLSDGVAREARLLDAAGKPRIVRIVARPVDATSPAAGQTGVIVDLTQEREVQERLRKAQKMEAVGRLAGGVAHDFNNLLSVILSYSELAANGLRADDPLRTDFHAIVEAAKRAESLTRQLLAFSRRQVLAPEPLALDGLVDSLDNMLRRLLGETVELRVERSPVRRTKVDRGQIEQVLMNLVVNARDAMQDGGTLVLTTSETSLNDDEARRLDVPPGTYVQLRVTDTGVGMDAETQARVFEPFFTTKGVGRGTGLGLAMVYGIVKQSGGAIAVDSVIGRGTQFRVLLPVLEGDATETPSEAPSVAPGRGRQETILVVEDEIALRSVVKRVLVANGYEVLVAADADEALALARSHGARIHLLLSDVVMPKMNGRELAERLKPLCPQAKVLFTSGYNDDDIARHGVLGPHFLPKPFDARTLTRKVRSLLDVA